MIYQINFPDDDGKKYQLFRYPAGETQVRLLPSELEAVKAADDIHVTARIRTGEIMGLALLVDAINAVSFARNLVILPYLPYARADRRFLDGDCLGLKVFGQALQSIPCRNIVTLDAHSGKSLEFVDRLIDVSPTPIIKSVVETIPVDQLAVLLPDAGAKRYNISNALQCGKARDPITGKLSGFVVPSKEDFFGYTAALVIDDICDGGWTFTGLANALSEYGIELYLYVTHGIFSKGLDVLLKSYKHIYTTDSLQPTPQEGLTVIPAGGTILDAVMPRIQIWENGVTREISQKASNH